MAQSCMFGGMSADTSRQQATLERAMELALAYLCGLDAAPVCTTSSLADLRGLALKVMNVTGEALPEGAALNGGPVQAQDFLMNDINVHFLNDPRDVVRASELTDFAQPKPSDAEIGLALKTRAVHQVSTPNTLLAREYHSRAPFKLGSHVIRYFVTTCSADGDGIPTEQELDGPARIEALLHGPR